MQAFKQRLRTHPLLWAWSLAALVSVLLLAGCGGGGGGGNGNGNGTPAPTLIFRTSPPAVTTNGTVGLNWSTTNATTCTASGDWSGSKATNGQENVSAPTVAGTATFTLACTGEGGNISRSATVTVTTPPASGPRLVLAQTSLNVEALTDAPAPTRTITISLQNLAGPDTVLVGGSYSTAGITAPSLSAGAGDTVILTIPFKNPAALGPGTYTDQVIIRACLESLCLNHIAGSPQTISITYVVMPNPNPPSVSFSGSAVAVTHDNVDSFGTRTDDSIQFSIANRGTEPVFSRVSVTGAAVVDGRVNWNGDRQGTVQITLREPGSLRAGSYTGRVNVDFCHDAACTNLLPGSPGNIDVTYQVTGNALPNTLTLWNTTYITGAELVTSETRIPVLKLTLRVTNLPPEGLYVRHTPSATGLITGGVNAPPSYTSLVEVEDHQFEVTLKSPASLGSGIFSDSMTFEACFDAACSEVVPGSTYALTPSMLIMATEGVDYTRKVVQGAGDAAYAVWSPADGFLYVADNKSGGTETRIVQVDPLSGLVGLSTTLSVGDIHRLAVTSDGSYLYVGSATKQTLQRLSLPSLTPDLSIQLGQLDSIAQYSTIDIGTIPGQPQSVVVAVRLARTREHIAVRVYDDGTPRPEEVGPTSPATAQRWLVPASDPGQFISWREDLTGSSKALERLSVDASGIHVDSSIALPPDRIVGGRPQRVGDKLYHTRGTVLDISTGDVVGWIPILSTTRSHTAVLADERNRRLFVWTDVQGAPAIISHDLDTLEILAYAPAPYGTGSMVLWGDEGIAIATGGSLQVLSGPFFSSYRGEPRQE